MNQATDTPRLRPGLQAFQDESQPQRFYLVDRARIAQPISMDVNELRLAQLFNGRRTLREVQADFMSRADGILIPLNEVEQLVTRLDEGLFLDSPRFRAILDEPIRQPSCIGCYPAEPEGIRELFESIFTHPEGPGLPDPPGSHIDADNRPLRAALLPHIDYARGHVSYAWGFKELIERTAASLFVIIGTSHYSGQRFSLTRKHFASPLGVVPTDQAYIDRIVESYGEGLFDDPLAHMPEHSIELEVVMLQYLLEKHYSFRIVPLLVGSFHDCVRRGDPPHQQPDIQRMIEALRYAEAGANEPVCYIISGDLAHIGPKFDDPSLVHYLQLKHSKQQDDELIRHAEQVDTDSYFRVIASEMDARRICGLPPTYLALHVAQPSRGKLMHYSQYVHPQGHESVSFASMVFER